MRSDEEVRRAIALLGASFHLRQLIWPNEEHRREAMMAFHTLGWVAGADDTNFVGLVEYVDVMLQKYAQENRKNG